MRRPNHIILDFETSKSLNASNYWAINHLSLQSGSTKHLYNINVHSNFKQSNRWRKHSRVLRNLTKYTVKPNKLHIAHFLSQTEKESMGRLFTPFNTVGKKKPMHVLKYSQDKGKDLYAYLNLPSRDYDKHGLYQILRRYSRVGSKHVIDNKLITWLNLVNVNFLRKERLYTKLKYSRSPAFDIVSGGAAALLAGFIGFLISEKFGYELPDSGDFYYLFMYLVFAAFSVRPLLISSDSSKGFWHAFSPKRAITFYVSLLQLILKRFK